MPIPFDDPTLEHQTPTAAWLRLVEEADGTGIRAALFETSAQGEPQAFYFTRLDRRSPPLTRRDGAAQDALTSIVKTLFQADAQSPALILALADEVPPRPFGGDVRVSLPFCRVSLDEAPADTHPERTGPPVGSARQLRWETDLPAEGSTARRFLDEMAHRQSPYEPFQRAGEGLAEAFADQRVQAMAVLPGLTTVVSLSAPPQRPESPPSPSTAAPAAVQPATHEDQPPLNLAERLWRVLRAPAHPAGGPLGTRLQWPGELMPFQQDGVRALLDNHRLLLADDMGLGKTLQAIAALRILRAQGNADPCLVAAPAALLDQWRRETEKWAPELSAIIVRGSAADRAWQWAANVDVTLVSYDTLRSDFAGNPQSPLRRKPWNVVVADEAQRIKNRNDTSNALKGLQRSRSWALTGTPIENDEEELASILEFVDHDGRPSPMRYYPGPDLRARHRQLQLRRKEADVLRELPPKQVTTLTIDLHPAQRASYDRAERDGVLYLQSLGAEVRVQHVLELITKLKQICNADPETGQSSKLEDIKDRLERLVAQGHGALVFSQYTSAASGVAAAVRCLGDFNPLSYTGDMILQERDDIIDRFKTQDRHKVLALSLRAGGLGLNLQEASYVFHLDRWWNPAVEHQAEDRTHRIGQTVKVNVIKYSCANTIEERIDGILERKQRLFDQLVDDVSLDLSAQLTHEELLGLFGLHSA